MPEDFRPSSHNPPEQDELAPQWWSELDREDLPPDNSRRQLEMEPVMPAPDPPASRALRWAIVIAMVAVMCLGTALVLRATSASYALLALALFGIPAALACGATVAMLRRSPD